MEVSDPGTSVIQVTATDKDEGNNSAITYTLRDTPETHSSWFQIDPRSGLITTKAHVDCETDPMPKLTVIATDNGFPPLSSSTTVLVTIHDVNDNEPIFDQSFYNVSVAENETKGKCILKVSKVNLLVRGSQTIVRITVHQLIDSRLGVLIVNINGRLLNGRVYKDGFSWNLRWISHGHSFM